MDKMNNTDKADEAMPAAAAPAPRAMSRRRFASSGIAGAGALLTVTSAPALATKVTCRAPSGTLSGDLQNSHNTIGNVQCGGTSPQYYCGQGKGEWRHLKDKKFGGSNMFNCTGTNQHSPSRPKTYSNSTLEELITGNCGFSDNQELGKYFATAYLNISLKKINFITLNQLQTMWIELQKGSYAPTAGIKWGRYEVVNYLKRTYK